MGIVKRNIAANFAGNVWTALMSLAFIPLYIHFLGIEAYGLIGVFVTLQALTALLDLGLSSTLNREMARLSVREDSAQEMRDLLRTLETVFWGVALLIAAVLLLVAPLLTHHWLRVEALPATTIQYAIVLMGGALALQWPFGLYAGGLFGLQRQVLFNGLVIFANSVRSLGAVLVLWLVSPTILAFFAWQMAAGALQTALAAIFLWRSLPVADRPARFRRVALQRVWRFAAGMGAIAVLAVILTHLDKVILSRLLTLEMFGYYTLASVVAMSLYRLVTPTFTALFPRFSELVARGDEPALRQLYHDGCQLLSVLLLPVALVIAFFSPEILLLWTQNETTVRHAAPVLSLLVVGTALNGVMHLPYALQLAHGWTKLALYTNLVAVAVLVPLLFFATARYGAVGAAFVWVLLNSSYVLVSLQIMHTRLLPDDKWRWYLEDLGLPLAAALSVVVLGRWLLPEGLAQLPLFAWLAVNGVLAFLAAALSAPRVRGWISLRLRSRALSYGT